jgi:hypothetical protein
MSGTENVSVSLTEGQEVEVAIIIWTPDPGIFHEIKSPKNIIFDFRSHEKFDSLNYNQEIESI